MTQIMTLVLILKGDFILLALKKRGFGQGLWNGTGGKLEPGETIEQAAKRECLEEVGIRAQQLDPVAQLQFKTTGQPDINVSVFLCRSFLGEPKESEEMRPEWFELDQIPFEQMWPDDKYWLPRVLKGEKLSGTFHFDHNNALLKHELHTAKT